MDGCACACAAGNGGIRCPPQIKSFRIGVRLVGPILIGGPLFVDSDLLGQLVPLGCDIVEYLLARLARPEPGHSLPQRLFVLVDLKYREIKQSGIGPGAQRLEICRRIGPALHVSRVGVVRLAERVAQRIGQLNALGALRPRCSATG